MKGEVKKKREESKRGEGENKRKQEEIIDEQKHHM